MLGALVADVADPASDVLVVDGSFRFHPEMDASAFPCSGIGRGPMHRRACAGVLVDARAAALDATPSARRRFRVARRRRGLGGGPACAASS